MTFHGAVFDLDGVVVDTAKYHFLAWRRLARELGFEFTEKDNERLKGVSRMRSLDILLEVGGVDFPEAQKAVFAERKNGWYVEYLKEMGPEELLPGSVALLERLRAAGVPTALATASRNSPLILERLGIRDRFDFVADGTNVTKAKPDPAVFLYAAEGIRVPPAQCLVFEDAAAGVEAAHRAGMKAIGVGRREDLPEADAIVTGLAAFDPAPWFDLRGK